MHVEQMVKRHTEVVDEAQQRLDHLLLEREKVETSHQTFVKSVTVQAKELKCFRYEFAREKQ